MKRAYRYLKKQFHFFQRFDVPLYAANAAFYIILSVFPGVMLVVGLLPYFSYSQEDLLSLLSGVVPTVLEPLLTRVIGDISENSTHALISLTAITAVWSSSRGVYCIQKGLNSIHQVRESRSFLYRRAMSMVHTLVFLLALMLTLVIQGFGREISAFFARQNVPILRWIADLLDFRELIVLLLLTVLFAVLFCALPNRRQKLSAVAPGAALAALGWMVFTWGFSIYTRYFGSYSLLYGSLSIIAVCMLWLYICICILFYGCAFNFWLAEKKRS